MPPTDSMSNLGWYGCEQAGRPAGPERVWHVSLPERMVLLVEQADALKPKDSSFLCTHGHRSLPYKAYRL